jgi:hypothetical protein
VLRAQRAELRQQKRWPSHQLCGTGSLYPLRLPLSATPPKPLPQDPNPEDIPQPLFPCFSPGTWTPDYLSCWTMLKNPDLGHLQPGCPQSPQGGDCGEKEPPWRLYHFELYKFCSAHWSIFLPKLAQAPFILKPYSCSSQLSSLPHSQPANSVIYTLKMFPEFSPFLPPHSRLSPPPWTAGNLSSIL